MILNWSLRDLEVRFSQVIISLNCPGKTLGISYILQVSCLVVLSFQNLPVEEIAWKCFFI